MVITAIMLLPLDCYYCHIGIPAIFDIAAIFVIAAISHTVVCCVAKKASNYTVSILTGRKKTALSYVHSSMGPSPKHTIFALLLSPR